MDQNGLLGRGEGLNCILRNSSWEARRSELHFRRLPPAGVLKTYQREERFEQTHLGGNSDGDLL